MCCDRCSFCRAPPPPTTGTARSAVRGAGPEHNVIVLDGVQIHNPHRLGEFTSSFLNPATAASVALDASGLEARHGGRLSSVTVIETRNGRSDRRLAFSGSLGLTSGDVLVEGRLPKTETGTWWAGARGTYDRALMDRFGDAVPGFGDVQFKLSVRPHAGRVSRYSACSAAKPRTSRHCPRRRRRGRRRDIVPSRVLNPRTKATAMQLLAARNTPAPTRSPS